MDVSIFLALASNLLFTASSLGYRHVSRRSSALWMNSLKTVVAAVGFSAVTLAVGGFGASLAAKSTLLVLVLSGAIGLAIGDTFLLKSMAAIGSARTLILFSFHPIWTGFFAYLFLGQSLRGSQMLAVLCLMGCLYALASERDDAGRRAWSPGALALGLIAVTLDATGVLLTRYAFDTTPGLGIFETNAVRCLGAVLGLGLLSPWMRADVRGGWRALERRERWLAVGVSFTGTFLSLSLWLTALRTGPLAVLSAIAGAGPLFATLLESLIDRKAPTRALWLALGFFAAGFALLQL